MGGEGVGERTDVSLSMVLLSPPRATLVSSVGQQALVATVSVAHPVSDLVRCLSFLPFCILWISFGGVLYLLDIFSHGISAGRNFDSAK